MTNRSHLAFSLFLAMFPWSMSLAGMRYDQDKPLLSLHAERQQSAEAELDAILAATLSSDRSPRPKALVVYVHGRGNEPKKSFADSIFGRSNRVLEKIEQGGVLVLGVNWDSKAPLLKVRCDRPIRQAEAAGPLLARIAAGLGAHRTAHPDLWRDRKVVLLAHSMGGFVLRAAMRDPVGAAEINRVFDVKVIASSDVPSDGHDAWIPLDPPGATYVLSNPRDKVLRRSMGCRKNRTGPDGGPRLGVLDLSRSPPTIAGVNYIQFSAGERHRLFTKSGADGNPHVCNVVASLLNGRRPILDASWATSTNSMASIVPRSQALEDDCFRHALDDEDGEDD